MADITKCSSLNCPMKKTCYRQMAKSDTLQSWANFEYTCNEGSGFDYFILAEEKDNEYEE